MPSLSRLICDACNIFKDSPRSPRDGSPEYDVEYKKLLKLSESGLKADVVCKTLYTLYFNASPKLAILIKYLRIAAKLEIGMLESQEAVKTFSLYERTFAKSFPGVSQQYFLDHLKDFILGKALQQIATLQAENRSLKSQVRYPVETPSFVMP